jgi:hypothetical protein
LYTNPPFSRFFTKYSVTILIWLSDSYYFTTASQVASQVVTRKKALTTAAMQKQMQSCVAIHCMTWVYQMDAMKLTQVHPKMFDEYHGNPTSGTAPLVIDCLKIDNAFEGLWGRIDAT